MAFVPLTEEVGLGDDVILHHGFATDQLFVGGIAQIDLASASFLV